MKSTDLVAGMEYAVLVHWHRHSKPQYDPATVERGQVRKARLVSLDKYAHDQFTRFADADHFVKAAKGEKSTSFLVEEVDTGMHFLARSKEIVGEWAPLEVRWAAEVAAARALRAAADAIAAKREEEQRLAIRNRQRVEENTRRVLGSMFGATVKVSSGQTAYWRDADGTQSTVDFVQVDIRTMERFLERFLEYKEEVEA